MANFRSGPSDSSGRAPAAQFSARSLAALRPIRALVLADTAVARSRLVAILQEDHRLTVVGWGGSELSGATLVRQLQPDVVTIDVGDHLADSLATIAQIMAHAPTRVVVITPNQDTDGAQRAMAVVRAGALAVIQGPGDEGSDAFAADAISVRDVVRAAATVRLARPLHPGAPQPTRGEFVGPLPPATTAVVAVAWAAAIEAWLRPVLNVLANRCNAPVVLAVAPGEQALALQVLQNHGVSRQVVVVREPEPLLPGHVYVVDGDAEVVARGTMWLVAPADASATEVPRLFASMVDQFGSQALAILPAPWQGAWLQLARHWTRAGGQLLAVASEQRPRRSDPPPGPSVAELADLILPGPVLAHHLVKYLGSQLGEVRR